jgi:hypothetical protein
LILKNKTKKKKKKILFLYSLQYTLMTTPEIKQVTKDLLVGITAQRAALERQPLDVSSVASACKQNAVLLMTFNTKVAALGTVPSELLDAAVDSCRQFIVFAQNCCAAQYADLSAAARHSQKFSGAVRAVLAAINTPAASTATTSSTSTADDLPSPPSNNNNNSGGSSSANNVAALAQKQAQSNAIANAFASPSPVNAGRGGAGVNRVQSTGHDSASPGGRGGGGGVVRVQSSGPNSNGYNVAASAADMDAFADSMIDDLNDMDAILKSEQQQQQQQQLPAAPTKMAPQKTAPAKLHIPPPVSNNSIDALDAFLDDIDAAGEAVAPADTLKKGDSQRNVYGTLPRPQARPMPAAAAPVAAAPSSPVEARGAYGKLPSAPRPQSMHQNATQSSLPKPAGGTMVLAPALKKTPVPVPSGSNSMREPKAAAAPLPEAGGHYQQVPLASVFKQQATAAVDELDSLLDDIVDTVPPKSAAPATGKDAAQSALDELDFLDDL